MSFNRAKWSLSWSPTSEIFGCFLADFRYHWIFLYSYTLMSFTCFFACLKMPLNGFVPPCHMLGKFFPSLFDRQKLVEILELKLIET